MITVAQLINELITPVLGVIGVVLRGVGALGAGIVAGAVVRHGIDLKMQSRFFVPLTFLGMVLLFAAATMGTWSSPGTIAAVGIGLFAGYQFMRYRPQTEEDQGDDD
jgi:hypothetical protein